ncbi:DUF5085 family protein [Psychrobacillus sp. OK032]|uniref:DUF5085 family protein n=1 Tax=Psychrobacillus sp. OK032 TaxID=1884358 RepID=UPI0008AD3C63|nr:DUF5085 family protein [Psychrobacillus sp. OK032]SER67355.1 hypothetical protein SAMN05518872_101580 [Psychrobacillus sp. OK032]
MGIEMASLVFENVLTYEVEQKKADWQDSIYMLEDFTLNKDVYRNGPISFSFVESSTDEKSGRFTYYLPISSPVVLSDEGDFSFKEVFVLERALLMRQADQELDFYAAYEKVKSYANARGIKLDDTYYCVLLEVYGDYIIDLYVPVIGQGDEE